MSRIILPSIIPSDREIVVKGQNLKYLKDVLRISVGEGVTVLNGKGLALETMVRQVKRNHIELEVIGSVSIDTESPLDLVLIQGILKGDRMNFLIQKVTELGVKEIFPVVTERAQVRYTRRLEHWKQVAEEATRQSERLLVPTIHDVCKMRDMFDRLDDESLRIIFYEGENKGFKDLVVEQTTTGNRATNLSIVNPLVYYLVGPEGGFTDGEVRKAKEAGFLSAGLGKRILRAETASIVGAALLQFRFGDL